MQRLQPYTKHLTPTGRYKIVDSIIDNLYTLTYCDAQNESYNWFPAGSIWGLARINQDEYKKRYPEILQNRDQYTPLVPDDSYSVMAFFYDEGQARYIDNGKTAQYTMNLIVWFDRCKITSQSQEIVDIFAEVVRRSLFKLNADPTDLYIGREDVFKQFDLSYFDKQYMHSPYEAFRIKFTANERCDAHSNQKFIK